MPMASVSVEPGGSIVVKLPPLSRQSRLHSQVHAYAMWLRIFASSEI
jgi:hypothetical protein